MDILARVIIQHSPLFCVTMSNERHNYDPGRRLPTYLLWRSANASTLYSDVSSGIFQSTIATEGTRGSICSSISFDSCSVASPVMEWNRSDFCATLDTLKSNQPEMSRSRSNYCESNETRIVTNICEPTSGDSQSKINPGRIYKPSNLNTDKEWSDVVSSNETENHRIFYWTKDSDDSMDTCGNYYSNTNFNQEPEPMFPVSTPYRGEDQEEVQMKEEDGKPNCLVIVMSLY